MTKTVEQLRNAFETEELPLKREEAVDYADSLGFELNDDVVLKTYDAFMKQLDEENKLLQDYQMQ